MPMGVWYVGNNTDPQVLSGHPQGDERNAWEATPEQKVLGGLCTTKSSGANDTIIVHAPAKVAGLPAWIVTCRLRWRSHSGGTPRM